MEKLQRATAVLVLALAAVALPLAAQEAALASAEYGHYQVFSDQGEEKTLEIARTMEAALELFNGYLHFDLSKLAVKFQVRVFGNRSDYDQYLQSQIKETRPDFVFISYSDPGRSELVGFNRPMAELHASLLHYGLIQMLWSFVPTAPLWLGDGMAAYLKASTYDPDSGSFRWQPNYAQLASLKSVLKGPSKVTIEELLTLDKTRASREINAFYPTAWGLVHFLAQSTDKRYNRLLWDSISALQPGSSLSDNSARVRDRAFSWIDLNELQSAFEQHILGIKTFNELVKEGTDLYGGSKLEDAEKAFSAALALRTESHIPHYYLGLIEYQRKNYAKAADHYTRALELGIEGSLIHYALGVNAFADKKYDQAIAYLKKAKELDPKAYGEKADALLKRIEALK